MNYPCFTKSLPGKCLRTCWQVVVIPLRSEAVPGGYGCGGCAEPRWCQHDAALQTPAHSAHLRGSYSNVNPGRPSPAPTASPQAPSLPRPLLARPLCRSPSHSSAAAQLLPAAATVGAQRRCPPEARREAGGGRRREEPPLRRARSYKGSAKRRGARLKPWVTVSPARTSSGSTRSSPTRSAGRRSWVGGGARQPSAVLHPWTGRGRVERRFRVGSAPCPPLRTARDTARAAGSGGCSSGGLEGCFPPGLLLFQTLSTPSRLVGTPERDGGGERRPAPPSWVPGRQSWRWAGDTAGRSAAPAAGPRPMSARPAPRARPAAAAGVATVGGRAGGSERGGGWKPSCRPVFPVS